MLCPLYYNQETKEPIEVSYIKTLRHEFTKDERDVYTLATNLKSSKLLEIVYGTESEHKRTFSLICLHIICSLKNSTAYDSLSRKEKEMYFEAVNTNLTDFNVRDYINHTSHGDMEYFIFTQRKELTPYLELIASMTYNL